MASIQKRTRTRPDGTRYTRHIVRWRDTAGTELSETFKTRKAATAFAARVEYAEATGQPLVVAEPTPPVTLAAWSEDWLDLVASRVAAGTLAPKTAEAYESRVRVHIVPRLGGLELRRMSAGDVEEALTAIQAGGRSAGTAVGIRRVLSKMLTDAQKRELVDRNVAALADAPAVPRRNPSTFTPEEMARILVVLAEERLGRMFLFAAITGLRASELRGLRWAGVDLDAGTYTVEKGVHRVGAASARVAPVGIVESAPKTAGSGQTTPMSDDAVELLREQRRAQRREQLAAPVWHDRGYVFTNRFGGALEPSAVLRIWKRVLATAEVPYRPDPSRRGRGLHELRRTFATTLRDAGIPVEDTGRLGRWTSFHMLLECYSASSDVRLRAAAKAAGAGILGVPTDPINPQKDTGS